MQDAILVFDVGTTNFKTVLSDLGGKTLLTVQQPLRPAYGAEGAVFQDPLDWRNAVSGGASTAAEYAADNRLRVAGIAVTASRSSVIPVDKNGEHIGPAMMWQETASRDIVNRVNQGDVLTRIFQCVGSRPNTVYSAPKMTWLKQNQPGIYNKAYKLVGIQDYIINFLTGEFVTDHTFGSRTLLMDIRALRWDMEMLDLFQVDVDKLCRLIPPASIAGKLTTAAAVRTGLTVGLPVITAGGDQNCAALGSGVVRQGDVMVNMGTGSFMVAAVDKAIIDPEMRVMCNASAVPGKWIIDAGMLATGSVHRWFVETFYNEFPATDARARYQCADAEAESAGPGCDGLFILTHFSGCGAPHWDNRAKGVFYGLGLGHTRAHMSRAVFEGIAGEIAANLAVAAELVGDIHTIRLAGGLSQCRFFDQLLADVCQRGLSLSTNREATAHGAWLQAMWALGYTASAENGDENAGDRFRPDPALGDLYGKFLHDRDTLFSSLAVVRNTC